VGFRFQRRVNLGGGWGVNTGLKGGSVSHRGRYGSFGSKGFSVRTGIRGLSFRQGWGKNAGAAALLVFAILGAVTVFVIAVRILLFVLPILFQIVSWVVLTIYDCVVQVIESVVAWRSGTAPAPTALLVQLLLGVSICTGIGFFFWQWAHAPPVNSGTAVAILTDTQKSPEFGGATPTRPAAKRVAPSKIHKLPKAGTETHEEATTEEVKDVEPEGTVVANEETKGVVAPSPSGGAVGTEPTNDDLAIVRVVDSAGATKIGTYCDAASRGAVTDKERILVSCRREEVDAWRRLVGGNEFPMTSDAIKATCTSPPFPASFVAEEACEKYETTRKTNAQ